MVSFKFASAVLLASVSDSSASFRQRRLSTNSIANYEPGSLVTDHNAVDLDQSLLQAQLATGTAQSFATAKDVYMNGAHSKSVATVTIASPLTGPLRLDTAVLGKSATGIDILGTIYDNYPTGATEISFQYATNGIQASYVGCQVGANPEPFTEGCLVQSGDLKIGSQTLAYSYDVAADNNNERTLQGFSTAAEKKMYRCDNCPYEGYNKFYEYYGNFQYGDEWVMAAFDGRATNYAMGNADFSVYTEVGREQAIKKGTVFLNVFMYVIREMEDAIDDCREDCKFDGCNDDPVHAWDEAVAFYTGSLEGKDGEGSGVMLHGLAESRCKNFKTCGGLADEITGNAHVNFEIFKQFVDGQRKLRAANCFDVKDNKKRIEELMAVPMIQGVLRYAHISNFNSDAGEKAEAEGAIFAAAILPYVHACDEDTAAVIYENMKTGGSADFVKVKVALESVYSCMNIQCSDVGGLHDVVTGEYLNDAAPCATSVSTSNSDTNTGLIVGLSLGGVAILVLVVVLTRRCGSGTEPATQEYSGGEKVAA